MTEPRPSRSQCPRCTAPVDLGAQSCGRCGIDISPTPDGKMMQPSGAVCPRCDRVAEPGSHFVGTVGVSEFGTCGSCGTSLVAPAGASASSVAYEEKAVACPPYELERMAQSEAVDGWTLLDTTVDPAAPENIVAYFRRGVRIEEKVKPRSGSRAKPKPKPTRRGTSRKRVRRSTVEPAARKATRKKPRPTQRPKRKRRAAAPGTRRRVERVRQVRRQEAGQSAPGSTRPGVRKPDPALDSVRKTVARAEADARRARASAQSVRQRARRAARHARREAKMARREAKALRKSVAGRRSRRAARRMSVRVRSVPADRVAFQAAEALGWAIAAALQLAVLLAVVAVRQVAIPTAIFAFWLCRTVLANVLGGVPVSRRHRARRYVSP